MNKKFNKEKLDRKRILTKAKMSGQDKNERGIKFRESESQEIVM